MNLQNNDVWYKAAVIGSIWASFEIIFGSFFHSLRLPFAGTFLTFTSIVLLIAFSFKWQDKNLFIRAGIVAALMRSLMPTSVILGPLIGIMIEAILFQMALNLFGRNLFSFSLAGILAMFSAILHKVVSIILIYGFDIVKILKNLYFVLLKSTHIDLPFNQLFWLVAIAYTLVGFASALLGVFVGRQVLDLTSDVNAYADERVRIKNDIFDIKNFRYQPFIIIIHTLVLIVSLLSLELYPLKYVVLPILLYLFYIIYRYGKSLRRLAKPLFWLQLIVILLIAVWLWNDKIEGLLMGVRMILRAILVVAIFTAISVELKNPLVKALLYKKGYSQLYISLGLATSAVPFILKNIATDKKSLLNPLKVLRKMIALSDTLLEQFKLYVGTNKRVFIISGDTRSGKTTFLKQTIKAVKNKNSSYKIGGIIAHGIDKNNERFGFEIEDVSNGQRELLCTAEESHNAQKVGRFYFLSEGLSFGKSVLSTQNSYDLVVVDEIGYMELEGKAWFEPVDNLIKSGKSDLILVVRRRLLEQFLQMWQDANIRVFDIDVSSVENMVSVLLKNQNL